MNKQILSAIVVTATVISIAAGGSVGYSIEPATQLVPIGAEAKFTVVGAGGTLAYQWLRNGAALAGQTNQTLIIVHAQVRDVARYSCMVSKGKAAVPTRPASLLVFTSGVDPHTGVDPMTEWGLPSIKSGSQGVCPGAYIGYVNYAKSATNGWGWVPDTSNSNTVFTATDTNRTDTRVVFTGMYLDCGCNKATVTVPNPPFSPAYQFIIYFTNDIPTNPYAIVLNGFKP